MRLIGEITNHDIGYHEKKPQDQLRERFAARAILLDAENNVALIEAKNIHIHKILGGGVEDDEEIIKALEREIMEESGCAGIIEAEVGKVVEYRSNYNFKQTNYCYIARLVGEKGTPDFTEKEIEEGFELSWIDLDRAEALFASDMPSEYSAKFQGLRDKILFTEAKKILEENER